MISPKTNIECLTKLAMLKYFPTRESVVAEVGKYLNLLCSDDQEARAVVSAVLERSGEWQGPFGLRDVHGDLMAKKAAELRAQREREKRTAYLKDRDVHEASCPGIQVDLNGNRKIVYVEFCRAYWGELRCRKGDALRAKDPDLCERRLAEELAVRPGWISEQEALARMEAAFLAKRTT